MFNSIIKSIMLSISNARCKLELFISHIQSLQTGVCRLRASEFFSGVRFLTILHLCAAYDHSTPDRVQIGVGRRLFLCIASFQRRRVHQDTHKIKHTIYKMSQGCITIRGKTGRYTRTPARTCRRIFEFTYKQEGVRTQKQETKTRRVRQDTYQDVILTSRTS